MPFPFIPFPNCASVELFGTLAGQAVELTFGVRKGSALDTTDLSAIAAIFDGWYHDHLRTYLTASVSFNSVKVTDLSSDSAPIFEVSLDTPHEGGVDLAVAPSNVSMVVKFTTASRGRSYRGRNYIPGLPASDQESPGEWGATPRSNLADQYQILADALGVGGYDHVVLSRVNGGVRRTTGVATRVTGYTCRAPIGTQRRRVPGVGI